MVLIFKWQGNCQVTQNRFAKSLAETCRWCSRTGFVNLKIQNRELPYASARWSKPLKGFTEINPGTRDKAITIRGCSLRQVGLRAANESKKGLRAKRSWYKMLQLLSITREQVLGKRLIGERLKVKV